MGALTAIGEVGIEVKGRSYLLRPSLFAMTRIGSPTEIVEACALLLGKEPLAPGFKILGLNAVQRFKRDRLRAALTVWFACSTEDVGDLIGGITPRMAYSPGWLPISDIVAIAQGLIWHGVMGNIDPNSNKRPANEKKEYLKEFEASSYVYSAVAHLGLSESEAWNLTMTGFVSAMQAKFPPQANNGDSPSLHKYDETMSWFDKVKAKKAANNG
jgi:hypothetical protein